MLLLPLFGSTPGIGAFEIEDHTAELPPRIKFGAGLSYKVGITLVDGDFARMWRIGHHGKTIPYVENKETTRLEMPLRRRQRRHQVAVLALVAKHGEHHQNRIKALGEIDCAN